MASPLQLESATPWSPSARKLFLAETHRTSKGPGEGVIFLPSLNSKWNGITSQSINNNHISALRWEGGGLLPPCKVTSSPVHNKALEISTTTKDQAVEVLTTLSTTTKDLVLEASTTTTTTTTGALAV